MSTYEWISVVGAAFSIGCAFVNVWALRQMKVIVDKPKITEVDGEI